MQQFTIFSASLLTFAPQWNFYIPRLSLTVETINISNYPAKFLLTWQKWLWEKRTYFQSDWWWNSCPCCKQWMLHNCVPRLPLRRINQASGPMSVCPDSLHYTRITNSAFYPFRTGKLSTDLSGLG